MTEKLPESTSVVDVFDVALVATENRRVLLFVPVVFGVIALAASYLITPTYIARTVIVPPQQQQSAAAVAMQSLGALAGLAGSAAGIKSPIDQYVSLMQSVTVSRRIVDEFGLRKVYGEVSPGDARKILAKNTRIEAGKKDGLLVIEVEDEDPQRAADVANGFVRQLQRVTSELAMTEAQQRRQFFETQLRQTKDRLAKSQKDLQASGISEADLRSEPRAAAQAYAALRAQVTAAAIRLESLKTQFTADAPEYRLAQSNYAALRAELGKMEKVKQEGDASSDYIDKYREFKYQEVMFELFTRQFEMAKMDEAREGGLIQVVDPAEPPEKKSKPKRGVMTITAAVAGLLLSFLYVWIRSAWRARAAEPSSAAKLDRLKSALGR